jgi:hypothetical protein
MNFQQRLLLGISYEDLKENKIKRLDKLIDSLREIHQYIENVYFYFLLLFLFIYLFFVDSVINNKLFNLFLY